MKTNKVIIIIAFLSICISLFSEKEKVIDNKNEFKGKTIEYILEKGDKFSNIIIKEVYFYDKKSKTRRIELFYNNTYISQHKIEKQIVYFDKKGNLLYYEDLYTKEYSSNNQLDIKHTYVNSNQQVKLIKYFYKNKLIYEDYGPTIQEASKFEYLSLKYIEEIFKTEYEKQKTELKLKEGPIFILFGKGLAGRSIVNYKNQIKKIDENDKEIINYYSNAVNYPKMKNIYKNKIIVETYGKKYELYFQESLFQHLKENENIMVNYYCISKNNKPYFFVVTFREEFALFSPETKVNEN